MEVSADERARWLSLLIEHGYWARTIPKQYGGYGAAARPARDRDHGRGVQPRRRRARAQRAGPRDARADAARARQRGAEAALDRPDAARRGDLVPGLFGAGRGQRPREPHHLGARGRQRLRDQRQQDLDQHRGQGADDVRARAHGARARPSTPASPTSCCRWTRPASRCARSRRCRARSATTRSTRCSSATCACRRRTWWASAARAGRSPTPRSCTSARA